MNWILDAYISDFFSKLDRTWLRKFLEHRIADKRILRLIDKWLAAGVIEDAKCTKTTEGSAQGASVSPCSLTCTFIVSLTAGSDSGDTSMHGAT
ncbi:hypothetical protein [Acidithrix sp. C25]|uniref:hypothetical protein n=1 Tax=Acidithrix sp. C25 TaxID=1671482 RepID=UPI0032DF2A0B